MTDKRKKTAPPPIPPGKPMTEVRKFPIMSVDEIMGVIESECDAVGFSLYNLGKDYVIILPEAWEELKQMIGWGKRTPSNVYEQLYQGMGHYLMTPSRKRILVISHFLYIYAANRSPLSACMNDGKKESIARRLEYEREIYNENETRCNVAPSGAAYDPFVKKYGVSEVALYGHTHPNLGAFFSYDDRNSGYANPNMPAAIFVADPIRKELKAAVGIEQNEAQIIVCEYVKKEKSQKEKQDDCAANKEEHKPCGYSLLDELAAVCNEILDKEKDAKGFYKARKTLLGKKHIRVDIKLKNVKKTVREKNEV